MLIMEQQILTLIFDLKNTIKAAMKNFLSDVFFIFWSKKILPQTRGKNGKLVKRTYVFRGAHCKFLVYQVKFSFQEEGGNK